MINVCVTFKGVYTVSHDDISKSHEDEVHFYHSCAGTSFT